jgi:hypothetical protein
MTISQKTVLPKTHFPEIGFSKFSHQKITHIKGFPMVYKLPQVTLWISVVVVYSGVRVVTTSGLCVVEMLLSATVSKDVLGSAMGLSKAVGSVSRGLSRVVCGRLYSWSLTNVRGVAANTHPLGFPLDTFFVFLMLSALTLLFVLCAVNISASKWVKESD